MSELCQILVAVISYIIIRFFVEPIYAQNKIIKEINYVLNFYRNCNIKPISNQTLKGIEKASNESNKLAHQLYSKTDIIPCYNFLTRIKIVLKLSHIRKTVKELIYISNDIIDRKDIIHRLEEIKKLLKLED